MVRWLKAVLVQHMSYLSTVSAGGSEGSQEEVPLSRPGEDTG